MGLVDIDNIRGILTQDWFLDVLLAQNGKAELAKELSNMIYSVPEAYDVDRVMDELGEETNGFRLNLSDTLQVIIDNIEDSSVNISKLIKEFINKLKENHMVDLEAIAAQIREDIAKLDKKQTNYERIISMKIDELVDWMFDLNIDSCEQISFCKNYKKCTEDDYLPDKNMCKECLKEWLQQEVKLQ